MVSNPPYSTRWAGDSDQLLIDDECFSPAAVLAPKSKATWLSLCISFPGWRLTALRL
ncbi:hypothetical protein ACUIAC_05585 [Dermabacteraceae bacterium P13138]